MTGPKLSKFVSILSKFVSILSRLTADAGRRVYSDNDTRTGLAAFRTGFGDGAFVNILD